MSRLRGHCGPVFAADFSSDSSLLLTGGADGAVRLWSVELREALAAYRGHRLPVWAVAACPLAPCYFASAGADRAARLWSTERAKPLRMLVGEQRMPVGVRGCYCTCSGVACGGCLSLLSLQCC